MLLSKTAHIWTYVSTCKGFGIVFFRSLIVELAVIFISHLLQIHIEVAVNIYVEVPMKMKIVAIALFAFMLSACASVYKAENFAEYQNAHKTVAIMPFQVMASAGTYSRHMDQKLIDKQMRVEGLMLQTQMYSRFLKKAQDKNYTVEFQNIDETQALLRKNNMTPENISEFTNAQIGAALGVDAVLNGRVFRAQPSDKTEALILSAITKVPYQNEVRAIMTIHDTASGDMIWSYDHDVQGNVFRNTDILARDLIKGSAKKFPYVAKD